MSFHDRLDESKAQACPLDVAGLSTLDPIEFLEEPILIGCSDADPRV